jgi:PAS domain S-box-containing protein
MDSSQDDAALLRRAEQELHESQEHNRLIVESAFDAIIAVDHDGSITEFNPAAQQMFGWQRAEVIGRELAEVIIPPAMREAHRAGLKRHRDSAHAPRLGVRLELMALRRDGAQFPVEVSVARMASGGLPKFTAFIRDLTEVRKAELALSDAAEEQLTARIAEKLKASEHQYRSLFVEQPLLLTVYDPETLRFLAVNAAGLAHYGYTEEEFLQLTIEDMRPEQDREAWRRTVFATPLQGKRQHRGRHRKKNGDVFFVETHSNDIMFQGKAARVVLAIDVTEQRRAALELRRSEARFRALTKLSADWFWEQDEHLRFVNLSSGDEWPASLPPPANVLGRKRWEIAGLETDDWEAHRAQLERREPFRELEIRRRAADGSVLYVQVSGSPVFDDRGNFTGYRGVTRDVTAARRAQDEIARLNAELEERVRQRTAQLEAANADLEAFSYSIAHDLRSPLTSIDGFTHLLEKSLGAGVGAQGAHFLRRIRAGVLQMSELTDAMLSLARLSGTNIRCDEVDLAAVARSVLAQLAEREPGRQYTAEIPEHLWVRGDARLLAQVIANLLGNAWKFSARKPRTWIRVGSEEHDGETVYVVADRGAGFDIAHASRLFRAFQRLHGASEFEGTGIGLALVHKILLHHGGRIWATARPDEGASFYFTLGTS